MTAILACSQDGDKSVFVRRSIMRKKFMLMAFVLMFGLAGTTSAVSYWNGSGTQAWTDPCSWTGGVPTGTDNGYIEAGVPGAIIDYTMNLSIAKVAVGYETAGDAYLYMYGGTLNVNDRVYVGGEKGNKSSNGNFIMEFGTINLTAESSEKKFYIGYKGPDDKGYFTMKGGTVNNAGKFYIAGEKSGSWGYMEMSNGTVNINAGSKRMRIAGKGGTGTLVMKGGTIHSTDDINMSEEGGYGYLYMTGGHIIAEGDFQLAYKAKEGVPCVSEVHLDGGIIDVGNLTFYRSAADLATPSASFDITLGTLLVGGDVVSEIQDFVDDGLITAFDGSGCLCIAYHPGWDKTIVNACIPEPATIALLGLGGLSLLRRRRR
jgi:hypothetical protein